MAGKYNFPCHTFAAEKHIIPASASFNKELNPPLNVRAGDGRITMFAKKKVEENYS